MTVCASRATRRDGATYEMGPSVREVLKVQLINSQMMEWAVFKMLDTIFKNAVLGAERCRAQCGTMFGASLQQMEAIAAERGVARPKILSHTDKDEAQIQEEKDGET